MKVTKVEAFSRLHGELFFHGAPGDLVTDCLSSAVEEARHAVQISSLAERFGGVVQEISAPPSPRRSLMDLALENAVEGCVRETYSALESSFQAEHASDEEVREIIGNAALGGTARAAFVWRLHAWLEDQLSVDAWSLVEKAMIEAIEGLRGELRVPRSSCLISVAGLPDEDTAQALLDGLAARLWPCDRMVA